MSQQTRQLLARNVVSFRYQLGWSQEFLAIQMASSAAYISQIENGHRNVSIDFLDKLAFVFQVEPHQLLMPRPTIHQKRVDERRGEK